MRIKSCIELDEMQGYCDLGMAKDCLKMARKLIRQKSVSPAELCSVINVILIQVDQLKPWRKSIEMACKNYTSEEFAIVRRDLFDFYCRLRDFKSAWEYRPKKHFICTDYVYLMLT